MASCNTLLICFCLLSVICQISSIYIKGYMQEYIVQVNGNASVANVTQFWTSTGFCPPEPHQKSCDWFLSPDMTQNLGYIGALPFEGIKQVRIHWLLDAIHIERLDQGVPVYNFSCLDHLILNLFHNGLKPGFEIMGNPSTFFDNFENTTQVYLWRDLVFQIGQRYVDRFGLGYVSQWNFESWNEPRRGHFDLLNFTNTGFNNYYDACSEGLRKVSPLLRLGAPGGDCHDYDPTRYCWSLLGHIHNEVNYFTHKKDLKLDYISIHRKGEEPNNSKAIMKKERQFFKDLKRNLPKFVDIPVVNDEADPLVGWSKTKWWRSDATYAAMEAKIIIQHQEVFFRSTSPPFTYGLLSNDNGFMSYQPHVFSQRTLLARFQINDTSGSHVQFIHKPAYTVMGLLALLGEGQLDATVYDKSGIIHTNGSSLGVLATQHMPSPSPQDSWQVSVLISNSNDSHPHTGLDRVTLQLSAVLDMARNDARYVVLALDNKHGNPYDIWVAAGKPQTPDVKLLQLMRDNQDPVRLEGPSALKVKDDVVTWSLPLPLPGVVLLHVCSRAKRPPDQVSAVWFQNITHNQVLVLWSDSCVNTKCIKSYEVEFSPSPPKVPYVRINARDRIFTSFVFAPLSVYHKELSGRSMVTGSYRVRAVDYWARPGPYSLVTQYGKT